MVLDRVSSGLTGPPLLSGFVLALANMAPIVGAIMWDWNVFEVIGIYWAESLIIGALNIPRMQLAKKRLQAEEPRSSKLLLILFFVLHFGIFCVVHGFFVFFLLDSNQFDNPLPAGPVLLVNLTNTTGWAFLLLFLSHLFSFFWNFVGQREYREAVVETQMFRPYHRVVILQILVLFGAFAIALLGGTTILLLALITGKTALDLGFHFYFHSSERNIPGYPSAAMA